VWKSAACVKPLMKVGLPRVSQAGLMKVSSAEKGLQGTAG
jgi:hypothetical protein